MPRWIPICMLASGLLALSGCARVDRAERQPPAIPAPPGARPDELTSEQRVEIHRVAQAARDAVRGCFEAALRVDPGLRGKITLRFKILFDGSVHGAEAVIDEPGSPTLVACLLAEAGRWRTSLRPASALTVEYPFAFRAVR